MSGRRGRPLGSKDSAPRRRMKPRVPRPQCTYCPRGVRRKKRLIHGRPANVWATICETHVATRGPHISKVVPQACKFCGLPSPVVKIKSAKGGWFYPRRICDECTAKRAVSSKYGGNPYLAHRKSYCEHDGCPYEPSDIRLLQVDHIVPRSWGGTDDPDDPSNLQTLCPNHHAEKTLLQADWLRQAHAAAAERNAR